MIMIKLIDITTTGITFLYKGDQVIYVWLWKRNKFNDRFYSIVFNRFFCSLKELSEYWKGYYDRGFS